MRSIAVIGKNFGDEGKGLVTADLCFMNGKSLVVKHNGGAQAGHTVESADGRFVHHQIASGAEFKAVTLWAGTYTPDLYALGKEIEEFAQIFNRIPVIFAEPETKITTIDDVLLNMAVETGRGDKRHGSCGMGIDECRTRGLAGYSLTVKEVKANDGEWILRKLTDIRKAYTRKRISELGIRDDNEYLELLDDDDLLRGYALQIKAGSKYVSLTNADAKWLEGFDCVVFESGQGLLLDEDLVKYAPHLTSSKTGIQNPVLFMQRRKLQLDEAIYVTRTYVTRHGAGPLPCECGKENLGIAADDETNRPNEWQGTIRYAKHENPETFLEAVKEDTKCFDGDKSICLTHLDETKEMIIFDGIYLDVEELKREIGPFVSKVYKAERFVNGLKVI